LRDGRPRPARSSFPTVTLASATMTWRAFARCASIAIGLLIPIVDTSPQVSSVMLADGTGREHMLLQMGEQWRNRCTIGSGTQQVHWLEWTDDGAPVERVETMDYDPRTRPWFQGAVAANDGNVYWTEPYTFYTTKEPGITVSARYDRGDGVERVIGFDVLLKDISEFTRNVAIGERGVVAVLTADRRLVGLPGVAALDDPDVRATAYLKRPQDLGLTLINDATAAVESEPRNSPNITCRFESGGEAWWGCAQPYSLTADQDLRIAILLPEAEVTGNLRQLRFIIIVIVIVVLAFGVFRAAFVARRFSRPIEALVEQSRRITQGELEATSQVESPIAEINALADAQEQLRQGIIARLQLEKVERDLDLARDIQRTLLPTAPPVTPGFEVAGWNQPADKTGGDYFDWLELPDGRTILTLADVTGHGIGPALIVAVCRAYMRAATSTGSASLSEAIARTNELLSVDIPDGRFVTAAIGILNPEQSTLELISAGQAPILFYEAASNTVHNWHADELPLGIMRGLAFDTPRLIAFKPGDMLLLTTDGFMEWPNAENEQFGTARLETFLRDHHDLEPEVLIERLHEAVLAHAGDVPQGDDLTAVVIRKL
jgi:serine phosphatase RsbU (regulator of sigma subunit)